MKNLFKFLLVGLVTGAFTCCFFEIINNLVVGVQVEIELILKLILTLIMVIMLINYYSSNYIFSIITIGYIANIIGCEIIYRKAFSNYDPVIIVVTIIINIVLAWVIYTTIEDDATLIFDNRLVGSISFLLYFTLYLMFFLYLRTS